MAKTVVKSKKHEENGKGEPITGIGQGKYSRVLKMVRDMFDPKYVKQFEKNSKKLTVWVYIDAEENFVQVFKRFKSAKQFIGGLHPKADLDQIDKNAADGLVWGEKCARLMKSKIIKA